MFVTRQRRKSVNSKLGLHIQTRPPHWKEFIKATRPCVVKSVAPKIEDEWEQLIEEIRQETGWPDFDIFLLGRIKMTQQPLEDPEAAALALWNEIKAKVSNPRLFDAWEGYNETASSDSEQIKKLARFDAEFARILHQEGLKAAVGGFSHSNPALSIWQDYYETALPDADFLHLHEYSWPDMQNQEGERCLYYRKLYAQLPVHLRRPLIISECGLDSKSEKPNEPHRGWRDSGHAPDAYMKQLEWYDSELQKDDYVIGATIFTYGSTDEWVSFDVYQEDSSGQPTGILKELHDYLVEHNTEPQHWWWIEAPEPVPVPGAPATLTLVVQREDLAPVQGAAVRLIGPAAAVAENEGAATDLPLQVAWTRVITDFFGNRWQCWMKFVMDEVIGITWQEFMHQVADNNPALEEDGWVFLKEKTYILPENVAVQPEVFWTRRLTGFFGSRWDAWERFVKGKAAGITWSEFVGQVVEQNPVLAEDGWVFQREKTYWLPQNIDETVVIAGAYTDASGRLKFTDLPAPGSYQLSVDAADFKPFRGTLAVETDQTFEITLEAIVPIVVPVPSDIIQVSGSEFRLNGQPIRFIGVNCRGLLHYGDQDVLRHAHPNHQSIQLQFARQIGARVVRLFLANRFRGHNQLTDRLSNLLQLLEPHDMYAIVCFTDVHGDYPYNVNGDMKFYTVKKHVDMLNEVFFRTGYKEHYLPLVKHVVEQFKNHPRIFAWELGNELKPQDQHNLFPGDFVTFAHDVAQEIRALDPAHLITTGLINTGNLGMSEAQAKQLYGDANLNFLTVHMYPDVESTEEKERGEREARIARELGKPLIVEEFGLRDGDRSVKGKAAMNKWFDVEQVKGFVQWGFMATDQDNGDGDGIHGMHRDQNIVVKDAAGHTIANHKDFDALKQVYHERASAMPWGGG
jgi:hypothetical protein